MPTSVHASHAVQDNPQPVINPFQEWLNELKAKYGKDFVKYISYDLIVTMLGIYQTNSISGSLQSYGDLMKILDDLDNLRMDIQQLLDEIGDTSGTSKDPSKWSAKEKQAWEAKVKPLLDKIKGDVNEMKGDLATYKQDIINLGQDPSKDTILQNFGEDGSAFIDKIFGKDSPIGNAGSNGNVADWLNGKGSEDNAIATLFAGFEKQWEYNNADPTETNTGTDVFGQEDSILSSDGGMLSGHQNIINTQVTYLGQMVESFENTVSQVIKDAGDSRQTATGNMGKI